MVEGEALYINFLEYTKVIVKRLPSASQKLYIIIISKVKKDN